MDIMKNDAIKPSTGFSIITLYLFIKYLFYPNKLENTVDK